MTKSPGSGNKHVTSRNLNANFGRVNCLVAFFRVFDNLQGLAALLDWQSQRRQWNDMHGTRQYRQSTDSIFIVDESQLSNPRLNRSACSQGTFRKRGIVAALALTSDLEVLDFAPLYGPGVVRLTDLVLAAREAIMQSSVRSE
jgi:hypothetical protein